MPHLSPVRNIDSTSWETCRTTCDADPGDATAQWSVNVALTGSSDGACVQQLLQLFFGSLSWYDGKLYLSMRRTLASARRLPLVVCVTTRRCLANPPNVVA